MAEDWVGSGCHEQGKRKAKFDLRRFARTTLELRYVFEELKSFKDQSLAEEESAADYMVNLQLDPVLLPEQKDAKGDDQAPEDGRGRQKKTVKRIQYRRHHLFTETDQGLHAGVLDV